MRHTSIKNIIIFTISLLLVINLSIILLSNESIGQSESFSSENNRDEPFDVTILFGGSGTGNVTLTNLTNSGNTTFSDNNTFSEYAYGDDIKLEAFPDIGNKFGEWIGAANSDQNPIEITVENDLIIMAKFIEVTDLFEITIIKQGNNANQVNLTNISRGDSSFPIINDTSYGNYKYGEIIKLDAIPLPNTDFLEWFGAISSTENPLTITITQNYTVIAEFSPTPEHILNIITSGTGMTIPSSGTPHPYPHDTEVTIEAIPESDWVFTNWSGDLESTSNLTTIVMDEDKTITANFDPKVTLSINITNETGGTTNPTPGIHNYPLNSMIAIEAIPEDGYRFVNWTGDLSSTNNPETILMDDNKSINATFTPEEYTVNITFDGCGIVNATYESTTETVTKSRLLNHKFAYNDQLTLRADPCTGWEFTQWQIQQRKDVNTSNPLYLRVLSDLNITVTFEKGEYHIYIQNPRNGTGFVDYQYTSSSGTIDMNANETKTIYPVYYDENVSLNAYPHFNSSYFETWHYPNDLNVLDEEQEYLNFSMINRDIYLDASFWLRNFTVNVSIGYKIPDGSGGYIDYTNYTTGLDTVEKIPDNEIYHYWENVNLLAIPDDGSSFLGWEGDVAVGNQTQNPTTITIDDNKTITAYFIPPIYNLTIHQNGSGTTYVNDIKATPPSPNITSYYAGSIVNLEAIPVPDGEFLYWAGDLNTNKNKTNISMNEPKNITAHFAPPVILTINVNGEGTTIPSPFPQTHTYPKGSTVDLYAYPDVGWSFSEWTGDFSSTENPAQLLMDDNKTITAIFTEDEYTVNVNITGCGTVNVIDPITQTITSPGEQINHNFTYNEQFTLNAINCSGYSFSHWKIDNGQTINITTDNPLYYRTLTDLTVTAVFTINNYTLSIHNPANGTGYIDHNINNTNDTNDLTEYQSIILGNITYGENVSLYAYPHQNSSYFNGWKYNPAFTPDDLNGQWLNFTMPAYDLTLDAVFWLYNFTLDINKSYVKYNYKNNTLEPYNDYPNSVLDSIDILPDKQVYHYGENVTLTAIPSNYTTFYNWTGDIAGGESTSNPLITTMTGNKSIIATFNISKICVNLTLQEGFNLITIPFENNWTAKTLLENISHAQQVLRYDPFDERYYGYLVGQPPHLDFSVYNGQGYQVYVSQNTSLNHCGYPINNVSVQLYEGFNLIGWYHEENTTASCLASKIPGCVQVLRYDSFDERYHSYLVGGPPHKDFVITQGMGIQIYVNQNSTWYGEGFCD